MTSIFFDLRVPALDGSDDPAVGYLEFTPTTRYNNATWITLPAPFTVPLVAGQATVPLLPTGPGWAWQIIEHVQPRDRVRYVTVPTSGSTVNYMALPDVDPTTLVPGPLVPGLSPTDGQVLVWSATAGAWSAANPVGAGRIAANKNITSTPTSIPGPGAGGGVGAKTTVTSTAISVTNSAGRPVVVTFGVTFQQLVAGSGEIFLILEETTSSATDAVLKIVPLPGTAAAAQNILTVDYELDIGVVTTTRTFDVRVLLYAPASNNPSGNLLNEPSNPSWCRADAK